MKRFIPTIFVMSLFALVIVSQCSLETARADQAPKVIRTISGAGTPTCLAADNDALWVGTMGGGITRITDESTEQKTSTKGLPGNMVRDCALYKEMLWVGTESGLALYLPEDDRFRTVLPGRIMALGVAGHHLVVARDDGRIYDFDGESISTLNLEFTPFTLATDNSGNWATGAITGHIHDSRDVTPYLLPDPVLSINFDGARLLIETASGSYEKQAGVPPSKINNPPRCGNNLSRPGIRLLDCQDRLFSEKIVDQAFWKNNVVLATANGVYKKDMVLAFPPEKEKSWMPVDIGGSPCANRIVALAEFNDHVWAATFDKGVCMYSDSGWQQFSGLKYLPSDMINDMDTDGKNLYIGTRDGLVIVDKKMNFTAIEPPKTFKPEDFNGPWNRVVNGVSFDPGGDKMWFGDFVSAHNFDGENWGHFDYRQGMWAVGVTRIAALNDTVAVGTGRQGIYLSDAGGDFIQLDDQGGLADNWVMDVSFGSDGALWAATCTKGVSQYKDGQWKTYTTDDGLVDDYALAVKEIGDDIWIGTLSGATVVKSDGVYSITTGDGLSGSEVHDFIGIGNEVWIATDAGITVVTAD